MAKSKSDYSLDADNDYASAKTNYGNFTSDLGSEYPEIQEIRQDISSLKDNVFELTRHVQKNSSRHMEDLKHVAEKQVEKLQKAGRETIERVENHVAEKPGQTVALAFVAGLAASFLFGRRK